MRPTIVAKKTRVEHTGSDCCALLIMSIHWLLASRWLTDNARGRSASSCKLLDSPGETGARVKVSVVYSCFPGT